MHQSTILSTTRVRIEARRAGHPSHFTKGRKGAIARAYQDLDTTGLLIEGSGFRILFKIKEAGLLIPSCTDITCECKTHHVNQLDSYK